MTVSQPVKQPLLVYAWIHFFIHLLKRRTEVFFQISPYVKQTRCQPIFCLTFIENFNFFWLLYIRSLEFERNCCLKRKKVNFVVSNCYFCTKIHISFDLTIQKLSIFQHICFYSIDQWVNLLHDNQCPSNIPKTHRIDIENA